MFYKRIKEELEKKQTLTIVLTNRIDDKIITKFVKEGLPRRNFFRKIDLMDIDSLIEELEEVVNNKVIV